MVMIKQLKINSFRGIKNLELKDVSDVNIILGGNGIGKTSILEVIKILSNPMAIESYIFRKSHLCEKKTAFKWFFPAVANELSYEGRKEISFESVICGDIYHVIIKYNQDKEDIKCCYENPEDYQLLAVAEKCVRYGEKVKVVVSKNETVRKTIFSLEDKSADFYNTKPAIYHVEYNNPLSAVEEELYTFESEEERDDVLKALRVFEPQIQGVEFYTSRLCGYPLINHKTYGLIPLCIMGDSIYRAYSCAISLLKCKKGILLIDEFENSMHPKLLANYVSWMVDCCKKYNVQLFITTYSLEVIDALLKSCEANLNDLTAFRLGKRNNEINVKRFSGDFLYDIRYESGQDVRS